MILFTTGAILLTLAALGFVLWPLWQRWQTAGTDRTHENQLAWRERLDELRAEYDAGTIDAQTFAALETELGASLLDDAGTRDANESNPPATGPRPGSRRTVIAAACLVPVLAVFGYMQYGAFADVQLRDSALGLMTGRITDESEVRALVERLDARVLRDPRDSQSWYLLGHSNMQLGDYRAAADAFEQLLARTGTDLNVMTSLAQANFLAEHGRISSGNRALMQQVLERQPGNTLVLEMLAIDAFNRRDFSAAADYLETALSGPVSGARAEGLRDGLNQARAMAAAGEGDGVAGGMIGGASANGAQIRVQLSMNPDVRAEPDSRIFIIARAPGGGVPVAVRAVRPADLPAEIALTDADSMQPERQLSQFDAIELIVRLSQSGDVAFGDGDLEARSPAVDPNAGEAVVLILEP